MIFFGAGSAENGWLHGWCLLRVERMAFVRMELSGRHREKISCAFIFAVRVFDLWGFTVVEH